MKFKKIAITGHSNGIGKAFFDYFKEISEVKGFDIENGYDITKDAEKIIDESLDYDLFINNANANMFDYDLFINNDCANMRMSQSHIAKLWALAHKHDPFFILQMSSASARIPLPSSSPKALLAYRMAKQELEKVHSAINIEDNICRSILISPGITQTNRRQSFDHLVGGICDKLELQNSLIQPQDIVDVTMKNLEIINDRFFVSFIEIYNRKLNQRLIPKKFLNGYEPIRDAKYGSVAESG